MYDKAQGYPDNSAPSILRYMPGFSFTLVGSEEPLRSKIQSIRFSIISKSKLQVVSIKKPSLPAHQNRRRKSKKKKKKEVRQITVNNTKKCVT